MGQSALTNNTLWGRREEAIPRGVASSLPIFAARAKNSELWDVEGQRYIDFASGIAVLNVGHNHPKVTAAVAGQLENISHAAFQVTPYEPYVALAERLNALAPGATKKKTIFFSTGAEAVENAVKIARVATGRSGVIAFRGGFHGRTLMTMALTGKVVPYKASFGPLPGEVYHAPFPNSYRGVTSEQSIEAIEQLFASEIEPQRVAAIIIEPVQGEGGFNVAPAGFLKSLRKLCDTHGILLIADEIQTGFARTGKMFAIEYAGIEPDLMTVAKSLGGGLPLSAVIGNAETMDAPEPGGLGGTYSGSPLACAAANAVLDIIEDEDLIARAKSIGMRITERLEARNNCKCIGDIRGLGAMVALELVHDRESKTANPELTKAIVQDAAKRGLILLACGTQGNVLRFLTPLTISDELLDEGLDILDASFGELTSA